MGSYLRHALHEVSEANRHLMYIKGHENTDPQTIAHAEKHLLIMYGVAALTLDAARTDKGLGLPVEIESEQDQFIALAYMLRCAPAHDISEPIWAIKKQKYIRAYTVKGITIDLSELVDAPFCFEHINGVEAFMELAEYAIDQGWA